jgi:hypothetical protein
MTPAGSSSRSCPTREEALIQKLDGRKELTDLQLDTIITYRKQLHLS